jgi:hypothetical protein
MEYSGIRQREAFESLLRFGLFESPPFGGAVFFLCRTTPLVFSASCIDSTSLMSINALRRGTPYTFAASIGVGNLEVIIDGFFIIVFYIFK